MLKTFQSLKIARDFRRLRMPFLQTLEDVDLIGEIGLYQARGHPVTLKLLFTKGIASVATVQRRLERLRRLGVVERSRSDSDKRGRTPDPQPFGLEASPQAGAVDAATLGGQETDGMTSPGRPGLIRTN